MHKNKINHLSNCDRFLPTSLTTLTLANNNIGDLNEVSRLVNLVNLTKISIANNPCVNMTGSNMYPLYYCIKLVFVGNVLRAMLWCTQICKY